MVVDGLSLLRFYYFKVNILIIHKICILHAFLKNTTSSLHFMWYTPEYQKIMSVQ